MAEKPNSINIDVNCVCKDIMFEGKIDLGNFFFLRTVNYQLL